jgi:hypothetical protein
MTSEEVLLEKIKVLPPDLRKKAIEFVDSLQDEARKKSPRVSLKGIWVGMNVNVTEEDIREARNEMWRGYTKDTEDEK